MAKNTGLGKGLNALFNEEKIIKEVEKTVEKDGEKIQQIKIVDIEPNRNQPRRKFDMESIEELAESIKIYGVIQPIIVNPKDGYYEIVAVEQIFRGFTEEEKRQFARFNERIAENTKMAAERGIVL